MTTINDLIVSLANDDMVSAGTIFTSIMGDKTNEYLDNAKVGIAQSFLGIEQDEDD
jgi:hypothetical protein